MINEAGCGAFVPAGNLAALQEKVKYYANMDPVSRSAVGAMGRDWILANRSYEALAREYISILTSTIDEDGEGGRSHEPGL